VVFKTPEEEEALRKVSDAAVELVRGKASEDLLAWYAYDASEWHCSTSAIATAIGCSYQRAARLIGRGRIVQALEEDASE